VEIGQESKAKIERLYERYLEGNSFYQTNRQSFADALTCVNRWLDEPDLPDEDRTWSQCMCKKLKSAKVPLSFPGGGTTRQ
jgi:hypothetical protein